MKGDKEARKQMSDEADVKTILDDDGTKLALLLSRLGECQRIQNTSNHVIMAEKPQAETGLVLIEQETKEESKL